MKPTKNALFALSLFGLAAALWSPPAAAAPPRPGELAEYAADGTLAERIAFAKEIGNDKFDETLIANAKYKMQRMVMEAQGIDPGEIEGVAGAPPPAWQGMPTVGTNKVLCLLVEFNDMLHTPANSQAAINDALFGNGVAANAPYESLQKYYQRSSYNKLTLQGNTLGWYKTAYNRSAVTQSATGRENLIKEVLNHYDTLGHDFSQYDNDGDGKIDLIYVIYAGPNNGWSNFWWAYQTSWQDQTYLKDGKRFGKYVFQFQNYDHTDPFTPRVIIHETGHALGIPDFYDYDDTVGPDNGVGGLDIMDGNRGDHNCFSKWILGWLTPTVVSSGSANRSLRPTGVTEDCIMIIPGASLSGQYSEFYMVQNRTKQGNDNATDWPGAGMMIWHIDSTLDGTGNNYLFNNSYTSHKLLRLMEADGLEQIENNIGGNAGDYYSLGRSFTVSSTPNSRRYDNSDSKVSVTNFSSAQYTMSAQFALVGTGIAPTVSITAPSAGASIAQGSAITISANAGDDNSVASVAFYADGNVVLTDNSAPYSVAWNGAGVGNHVLTAVATDNEGLTTTSAPVSIVVTSTSPPANDAFASRINISGNINTVNGTNVNGTFETSEPSHAGYTPRRSVWWTWTPSISGVATITTAGSNYDTVLAAYTGSSIGSLVARASNDDVGSGNLTSSVIFSVTAGVPIQIAVDGYNGQSGLITLNVSAEFVPPANDPFSGAIAISNAGTPVTVTGTNDGGTSESGEPAHAGFGPFASAWWTWTAPSTGTLNLSTAGSNYDTLLAVYTGTAVSGLTLIAANDDTVGLTSAVSHPVTGGVTYRIAVDGYGGATGNITLQASFFDVNDPPTVALSVPQNGLSVALGSTMGMAAEAYDPEGNVAEVRFYVNGSLVATVPSAPERITYEASAVMNVAGEIDVTATAVDNLGLMASTTVRVVVGAITLPEAVNNFVLPFVGGGDHFWFGTSANSHDTVSSARSGAIAHDEVTSFSTTVRGPGNISCWWRVSSEDSFDILTFSIDGVVQAGAISGEVAWTQASWSVPAGDHVLEWRYSKDGSAHGGSDAAWVDEIVWVTPPQIFGSTLVTAPTGVPLTYQLTATGTVTAYSVAVGTLPPGLALNTSTGAITGIPTAAGNYPVTLRGSNAGGDSDLAVTFEIFASLLLDTTLELPGFSFSNTGDSRWYGQSTVTHDGVDAAQSGDMVNSQSTSMSTVVTGPGVLSFWSKVSSEGNWDYLRFYIDDAEQPGAPGISGEVDWQQVTVPVPAGAHTVRWTYAKDASVTQGADAAWVDEVVFAPSIPVAVDAALLPWTTTGDAVWNGQILTTHDGVDAAQSGDITDSQVSTMEATVAGEGTLTFWWKVSSEATFDYLHFYLDGVEQGAAPAISGEVGWQQITIAVPAGAHTLRWTYSKDDSVSEGADAGWVDQVVFAIPLPVALDTTALSWSVLGDANWFGQVNTAHDGVDAGESGDIADTQTSSMETTVTGEGVVSFWWKVSSENGWDYLRFYVDGAEQPGAIGISGEVGWQQITVPVSGAGAHTLRWSYAKDGSLSNGADAGWVDEVVFTIPLPIAVDGPALPISTSGAGVWFGEALVTHDGFDAAQSGDVADDQLSSMETLVDGPVDLSFWWKVSSETNYDFLLLYIDGVEQPGRISGEVDWQQVSATIPIGTHTVAWVYSKDYSISSGADAGWVDEVTLTPLTGYALWAATNVPSGADASFTGVSLSTGVQNGIAYVFGSNPVTSSKGEAVGTGKMPAPPSIPADVDVYLELSAAGIGGANPLDGWEPAVSWVNGQAPVFAFPGYTSIVDGYVIDTGNPNPFFYRYRVVQR